MADDTEQAEPKAESGTPSSPPASASGDAPADSAPPARSESAPAKAEADEAATETSAPKKKKKKKRKPAAVEDEPKGPALGPEGWERPSFVLGFPKDPELDRVVRAFELGNYAYVREHAERLSEHAEDREVRRAAEELLERIKPDPLMKILFAMSIALLAFMVFYAYQHGH